MSIDSSDLWAAALNTLSEEDRKLVAFNGQSKLDVLSDLEQLVIRAKENSIKKRWSFHRPGDGQTVILRDLFSKIVVWIDRFKEIGDIVVQYDPVHAALPWAAVRFLLQLAVSDINKFAFAVEGAETIARSISRHATFEQIYLRYDTTATLAVKGLREALVKLYAANLIYLAKTKNYLEEHTPKRMAKAVVTSQSGFEDLLRKIDKELANVDRHARLVDAERSANISNTLMSLSIDQRDVNSKLRELLLSVDSPISRMSGQLDIVEDHLQHSERVEILRWLSSQPYLEHHQQIKRQALSGSGQWLLQDPLYIQWHKQSVSSLLWLHGKPGSGKSTLVSLVIEDMIRRFEAGQSALPVYFYCTRSAAEPERSKPDKILASILRQLSCIQPDAPLLGPVIEKYRRQGEGFKSNGLNLDDSRDLIVRLIEDYSMTTIVVDALDECDPTMRQSLLDAFEHILKESAGLVKIFVSSRNDQDIVYTLRDYPNLDISSERNTADIEAYVKTETRRLVKTGQLLRNSRAKGEMTASIIDHVSSGADGMFRWASLQLDVLRALKRDEDIRIQLRRLPPKLEQLYLEVYNNLISVQGEFSQSIIGNTLKWLLCAKEELRASEFLMAVAANLNTSDGDISVDSLLELCNNFVVYDEGLNVFRFAHLSVREFLETRPEFAKVSCYSLAAECCLLQIFASSNCPETERFMSDVHRLRLRGAPGCTDTSQCEKFLEYANRFWMEYCRLIPRSYRSDDTDFGRIFQFFLSDKLGSNSPLNLWVQWYCSRVLNGWEPAAAVKLQDFLTSCSESLSRSFLVATYFGFSEIVSFYTKDRGLSDDLKDKGVLLAAMAARYEAFDILRENRENWSMTEPVLSYAIRTSDEERLVLLLDKVHDAMITHGILAAVVEDQDDWKMTVLLDRYPGMTITEEVLDTAMEYASLDSFRLLLDRSMEPRITRGMLKIPGIPKSLIIKPIADSYVEKMKLLLDKVGEPDLTPYLVASAAEFSDEELIEAMLKKGAASNITDEVMVEAAQRGREVFHLMLRYGGKLTETMLDDAAARCDARAWQMLLEQGYESSVSVKRLKLAALNNSHGDAVLSILLNHTDDTFLANELAELVQDVARISWSNNTLRQLLDRVKSSEISQDMLSAANFNDWPDRLGRVKMFLERSSELRITEDMLLVAAADGNDGVELTQMFLEREGEVEISEYVLMAAARNRYQRYQTMQLLLERNGAADVTEDVLLCAVQHSNVDFVQELLEHSEARVITGCLLEAAAANEICGGELLKLLLARADLTGFPEDLLIEAVGNGGNGIEVLLLLEENYGRIRMSEDLLVKCVRRAAPKTIELLLSRTDRTQITKEVLISALRCDSDYITRGVAGKSLHVPITTDILEVAAEYSETDVFRFLWNRYRRSSVPESLINAAAKNLCPSGTDSPTQFEFLLHEADCVDIGEQTIIAIVGNTWHASSYFQLLLQRGLRADITAGGPNTLLMHGSIKIKCSSASPLKLSKDMKVTEDMFRIAASLGNEYLLEQLSKFCGLESTPERWLDIARLHNSAYWAQNDLLKTLIGRGSDPDVASPHGATPLVQAAWKGNEVGVQLLLSAGALPDGGPTLKYSPLCWAVAYGHYDVVKILVDAGASINFRDEEGRTPSMIAKQYRHFRVLKYLEERRIKQEGAGREVSEST